MPQVINANVANTLWKFTIAGSIVNAEGQSHPGIEVLYNGTSGNVTVGEHTIPIGVILRMVNMSHTQEL